MHTLHLLKYKEHTIFKQRERLKSPHGDTLYEHNEQNENAFIAALHRIVPMEPLTLKKAVPLSMLITAPNIFLRGILCNM